MSYEAWFWFNAGVYTMGMLALAVVKLVLPRYLRGKDE